MRNGSNTLYSRPFLNIIFIFCLLLIFFLPSFFLVGLELTSMSVGMMSATVFIFLLMLFSWKDIRLSTNSIVLMYIPVFIITITSYLFLLHEDITKPVMSILPVMLIFFVASEASKRIYLYNIDLAKIVGPSIVVLSLVGLSAVFGYKPTCCNYGILGKQMFPFIEPSHYALSFGPLAVGYAFYSSIMRTIVIALLFSILGLFVSNVTLVVFSMIILLSSVIRLKRKYLLLSVPLLIFFTLAVVLILIESSPHFAERLDMDAEYNKTTLFYLRGFELAYLNFIDTYGFGLGFQMLGSKFTSLGEYHDLIILLDPQSVATDSGFLAAKIIAEFGFFGIVGVLVYIYFIFWAIFKANSIHRILVNIKNIERHKEATKELFFLGVIVGLSVEIFLRSYGYFSPGVFLLLVAFFYLRRAKIDSF